VPLLWAFVSYLTLAVFLTYPLIRRPGTVLPNDLGDPLLNTWILWWNTQVLPLTERWWHASFFYPATDTLAFSEHLLGLLPISAPVQ
jgi:hypothetical protein